MVVGRFFQIDLDPNGDDYKTGFLMTYCLGHYTDSGIFFKNPFLLAREKNPIVAKYISEEHGNAN